MFRKPQFWLMVGVMVGLCAGLFVVGRDIGYRAGYRDSTADDRKMINKLWQELDDQRQR